MNASKENARKALTVLELMLETTRVTASDRESFLKAAEFLSEFLTAAERKLPGEGAYNREVVKRNGTSVQRRRRAK